MNRSKVSVLVGLGLFAGVAAAMGVYKLHEVAVARASARLQAKQADDMRQKHDAEARAEAEKAAQLEKKRREVVAQQQQWDLDEAEREKHAPCEGETGRCIFVWVMGAHLEDIISTDENGYSHTLSRRLQRLTVLLGGETRGDGLEFDGRIFEGGSATADLLCLENCFTLHEGSKHYMGIGEWKTHWRPCYSQYGSCADYDPVPYLSIGLAKWQILEVCGGNKPCIQLSTVKSRE